MYRSHSFSLSPTHSLTLFFFLSDFLCFLVSPSVSLCPFQTIVIWSVIQCTINTWNIPIWSLPIGTLWSTVVALTATHPSVLPFSSSSTYNHVFPSCCKPRQISVVVIQQIATMDSTWLLLAVQPSQAPSRWEVWLKLTTLHICCLLNLSTTYDYSAQARVKYM